MMIKKLNRGVLLIIAALVLAACGGTTDDDEQEKNQAPTEETSEQSSNMDDMEHSDSGEIPDDLEAASNPTYEVGSQARITTDHMKGMEGAEATIVGAYDTRAYIISYTPSTGGEKVENHKWVVQEEIENSGDSEIPAGEEVTVQADHMEGMEGVTATIDSSEETTVYMIDYESTTDGKAVKNHKWVTEEELTTNK